MAVEVLILTPVFLGLFLGMVEVALWFRDSTAVTTLARSGARIASSEPRFGTLFSVNNTFGHNGAGSASSFAWDAVQAIKESTDTIPVENIRLIRIYRDTGSGPPTTSCPAGSCIQYEYDAAEGDIVYKSGVGNPSLINACLADPGGMSVGVYIEADHDWVVGFFGAGSGTVFGNTVMKFEPLQPDHTGPFPADTAPGPGVFEGCK